MWLLILAGLLAISVGQETNPGAVGQTGRSIDNADDIVMLEIDVKEPVKRSPLTATTEYGTSPNQYIQQHPDSTQELSPEYLTVLQQYAQEQLQAPRAPQRNLQPAYAKQQQALQQAYYNYRKPTVVPPRPRPQLHPQALAQAELNAEIQAQIENQNRADAVRSARLGSSPSPSYQSHPKLGTFEQELLQLVSANQAQEFKLLPTQPKGSNSAYSQQLISIPVQYAKPAPPPQLTEQYHIETSPPRQYPQQHQQAVVSYKSVEEPIQYQAPQPVKAFNPSPQYDYVDDDPQTKAYEQAQAEAQAQAQARANAEALAFQKLAQAAYKKHRQDALEHVRLNNERYRQQSALEQIQQGAQVSDAGRYHLEEQLSPKGAENAYRAKLKAQVAAETAEARKLQQAAEFKAHADAIKKLEAQQRAHLKIQEQVHNYALNFEKNLMRAQELAQAQAEALYKSQQQARDQVNNEILAISKGQVQGKKVDPESPLYHYTLSTTTPLPLLNTYFTNDQLQKYQASGSSYVPRSVPKPDDLPIETSRGKSAITQPRQSHKLKIPSSSQIYVSESGLLKKSPIKSITIEEIEPDQAKGRHLTNEDISALVNQGYARPEYVTYEQVIQRPHKLLRKNKKEGEEKVTYLVPIEPAFGTRQPPLKHEE